MAAQRRQVAIVGDFDAKTVEVMAERPQQRLAAYAGLVIAPASPYRSMEGALAAVRFGRERGAPLVRTWGGFQHAIVEFARNVLGLEDAEHAETSPDANRLVTTPLACSLVGTEQSVTLVARTRAAALYGVGTAIEDYRCNYGVKSEYHAALEQAGLTLSGFGDEGEMRSTFGTPHPLFAGFATAVEAATAHR